MARRILVINPFGVGDILFSTPLLAGIKEKYPSCYIGYICNTRTVEILQTNPQVNEVFIFERDEYRLLWKHSKIEAIRKFCNFWGQVKKKRFEIALDLSLGKEYAFLCALIGIKERRGFNYKGRGRFLTHKKEFSGFNDKEVAEYYLDLLNGEAKKKQFPTVLIPADTDNAYIDDFLKREDIRESDILVGVAPGGGVSFGRHNEDMRRWEPEKFAELSDKVVQKFNAKVVLIWGPGEQELVKRIRDQTKDRSRSGLWLAPKTTVRQMAALCRCCKVVICSEGGPLHIASSQGVKTISIFGAVDEKVYGPYPPSPNSVVITSGVDCRPCYRSFKLPECKRRLCLEGVSVDTVFEAVERML